MHWFLSLGIMLALITDIALGLITGKPKGFLTSDALHSGLRQHRQNVVYMPLRLLAVLVLLSWFYSLIGSLLCQ